MLAVIITAKAGLILAVTLWPHRQCIWGAGWGDCGLTYHGDHAEGHDQREWSEGVGGEHAQLAQQHQKQAQPPRFGLEISPGVLGACQADVAVLLETQERM